MCSFGRPGRLHLGTEVGLQARPGLHRPIESTIAALLPMIIDKVLIS